MIENTLLFKSLFFQNILHIGQAIIVLSFIFTFIRFIAGPRAHDRIMSYEMCYHLIVMLLISYAIKNSSEYYFNIALVLGLLGFVSSIALAKFLMRGEVIE